MGPMAATIVADHGAAELNALGYCQCREVTLAGIPVLAVRLSYVGEGGWELTCPVAAAEALFDALHSAGARPAGIFAQTSMRIE